MWSGRRRESVRVCGMCVVYVWGCMVAGDAASFYWVIREGLLKEVTFELSPKG